MRKCRLYFRRSWTFFDARFFCLFSCFSVSLGQSKAHKIGRNAEIYTLVTAVQLRQWKSILQHMKSTRMESDVWMSARFSTLTKKVNSLFAAVSLKCCGFLFAGGFANDNMTDDKMQILSSVSSYWLSAIVIIWFIKLWNANPPPVCELHGNYANYWAVLCIM